MLVATGFWPVDVPFDVRDLATVTSVLNKANKQ